MASRISDVKARQVFDSRGNPTVEVEVVTEDGVFRAVVPSGASTGVYEAHELRDGGDRYMGKAVQGAVDNVELLKEEILGMDPTDQEGVDQALIDADGTPNKSKYGANAILGISMAVCRAGAAKKGLPLYKHINNLAGNPNLILPVPCLNVLNGGSHAGNKLAMQEFMLIPTRATTFTEAMMMCSEVYHTLKKIIQKKYGQDAASVGDEGGFAPNIQDNHEALTLLKTAIRQCGYAEQISLGMDIAASEFYDKATGLYDLDFKNDKSDGSMKLTSAELLKLYKTWLAPDEGDEPQIEIVSIEDPFDQDDWQAWSAMTEELGDVLQVVGDDLLVTNPERIEQAEEKDACNGLLLKVNQIGSVTESIKAFSMARSAGWGVMVSHRSGETEDTFIADLAVGLGAGQIKAGAPCRSERVAKYNQILRIEEDLAERAQYAGEYFRDPWLMAPVARGRSMGL
ncbi:Enolase [Porphyridium purpureum]|uniref:phosphopyruvate hydratase n=1 Tax=Porphyridium purpureum TaxID=35688 RepID=A0A5J4YS36_PORPP|nr:Enolase [Porphyridium purpureum]|eukprot:POR6343..scf229_5